MKKPIIIVSVSLLWCALLFVMLCSGCAWLNGDRGSPSANCHEITLANMVPVRKMMEGELHHRANICIVAIAYDADI